jgi:hypothetical protein
VRVHLAGHDNERRDICKDLEGGDRRRRFGIRERSCGALGIPERAPREEHQATSRRQDREGGTPGSLERPERPGRTEVERSLWKRLNPPREDLDVLQGEALRRKLQEPGPPLLGLAENERGVGEEDGKGDPGEPGARPQVAGPTLAAHERVNRAEGIQHVTASQVRQVVRGDQAEPGAVLSNQGFERRQLVEPTSGVRQPESREAVFQPRFT